MKVKEYLENTIFLLICLILNQAVEYYAFNSSFGSFLNKLNPFFGKMLSQNVNFAFGIPLPHLFAYVLYLIVLIIFISWYLKNTKNFFQRFGFWLILSGAISNLFDRFQFGYVRDFIYAFWGNIFNLADMMIVLGVIFIIFAEQNKKIIKS